MKLVLADVGPLYGAFASDDRRHLRSQSEIAALELSRAEIVVTHTTVLDAHRLIQRRLGVRASVEWLAQIRTSTGFYALQEADYSVAFDLVTGYPDQDITLFDALLHVVSERTGIPVWTYDHHFDILGTARWYPGS